MKKHWLLSKVEIHFSTLIYFILSLLVGMFKQTLTMLFIVMVHEFAHTMTSYCFNFKINKIKILPFGAFLQLDDFGLHHIFEEICVVIAGPLSHIILYAFFMYLYRLQYISFIHYQYCIEANKIILLFNLLPIYPLDGSKLIILISSCFFDYLFVLKSSIYISMVALFYMIYQYFALSYMMVYSFLMLGLYQYITEYYLLYHRLLTSRLDQCQYKKQKLHKNSKFYRPYHNYYFFNNVLYDEKTFILRRFFMSTDFENVSKKVKH